MKTWTVKYRNKGDEKINSRKFTDEPKAIDFFAEVRLSGGHVTEYRRDDEPEEKKPN